MAAFKLTDLTSFGSQLHNNPFGVRSPLLASHRDGLIKFSRVFTFGWYSRVRFLGLMSVNPVLIWSHLLVIFGEMSIAVRTLLNGQSCVPCFCSEVPNSRLICGLFLVN